ncbi:MAG: hypothetical protein ACD_3C00223G0007 [uncultured bacterium (gcode 4)]|uniref:Uncharacterized protein n=1 Tax=uncultured bacterium (gcode 4) TaxID=1234023 RepID=K2GVI0_9BACT|nr:MAG: hypothetical protein ACD_3C00223G0007 [uncultured bacterium (gcode 4)]
MIEFFVKLILLIWVAFTVIMSYYNWIHSESSSWYMGYIVAIILIYWSYKAAKTVYSKDKVEYTIAWLIWMTILHILILCMTFFSLNNVQSWSASLFFKILWFLVLPSIVVLLSYSFARSILNRINSFKDQSVAFKFLMSLGFWFVLFSLLLSIASFVWLYNYYSVFSILLLFGILWAKELLNSIKSLYSFKITFPNHKLDWTFFEALNMRLLSAEFAFIVMTFLIWVNFINIIRPMPIGWDDLWAYMNFPQIMANSWSILNWAWMLAWQIFTWIWFMFHSAPQAFFFNQVWWILSLVVLMVVFSDVLDNGKKRYLSLPIILATMFYAMPMVIFQQAKDMKLDPGLFFVSVIWIYLIYDLFSRYLWHDDVDNTNSPDSEDSVAPVHQNTFNKIINKFTSVYKSVAWKQDLFDNKDFLIYLFIIWTIVWLAFAIKVTTLMMILWILGVIFYSKLGFSWFLWYFFIFIWVFTRFWLWAMMNVNFPMDNASLINNVWYLSIALWILILSYSFQKYKSKSFKNAFILTLVFLLWVFAYLLPWFVKNISEIKTTKISVWTILTWEWSGFNADLTKIYNKDELKQIEDKNITQSIDEKWKTQNEDFWRYFWYEEGLNNYLRLPWNLTLQKNQWWEYTEITYFFLALLPVILLFLPYKNIAISFWVLVPIAFGIIYYGDSALTPTLISFFAKLDLPGWYIYIIWIFLALLAFFLYSLSNGKLSQIFKLNAVFFTMYGLIFAVAAFWIVWYWIAMYFALLLMIWIGASYITEEKEDELENLAHFFWSFILMIIILIYFFMSTIPHWFNNLKQASFVEYKAWIYNQEEGIFASHPDYFKILANLNVKDSEKYAVDVMNSINDSILKKIVVSNVGDKPEISKIEAILREIRNTDLTKMWLDAMNSNKVRASAKSKLNEIYRTVLYTPKNLKNDENIYRIWTFLTYFIDNNRNRFYDDSLVTNFDKYFSNENPDIAVERMKKIWLKYLLVDLNAATIDKDPRHDLTRRFENLLRTFRSSKLELIHTDSLCLQIALDENNEDYMSHAWVNYESYTTSWQTINRGEKQLRCYNHILDLIRNDKINDQNYPYLKNLADYFKKSNVQDQNKALEIFRQYVTHGWLVLFRIK